MSGNGSDRPAPVVIVCGDLDEARRALADLPAAVSVPGSRAPLSRDAEIRSRRERVLRDLRRAIECHEASIRAGRGPLDTRDMQAALRINRTAACDLVRVIAAMPAGEGSEPPSPPRSRRGGRRGASTREYPDGRMPA